MGARSVNNVVSDDTVIPPENEGSNQQLSSRGTSTRTVTSEESSSIGDGEISIFAF